MKIYDNGQKSPEEFLKILDEIEHSSSVMVSRVLKEKSQEIENISLIAHQAEWHIRGLTYYFRNLMNNFLLVAEDIAERAYLGADAIIMYSPPVQKLMFEFYALVNLAKISLDNLRNFLYPVFLTPFNQLPKSIRDYKSGSTDCPIYETIAEEPILTYLMDTRNCVVHFRTFATSDNTLATSNDLESEDLGTLEKSDWTRPMAKAVFRLKDNNGIVINIFLPDSIFEFDSSGGKKLARFAYKKRIHIISQSFQFVHFVALSILKALEALINPGVPTFSYTRIR